MFNYTNVIKKNKIDCKNYCGGISTPFPFPFKGGCTLLITPFRGVALPDDALPDDALPCGCPSGWLPLL